MPLPCAVLFFRKKCQYKTPNKAPENNLYSFVKKPVFKRSSIFTSFVTFVYPPISWCLQIYSPCQWFQAFFLLCVFKSIGWNIRLFFSCFNCLLSAYFWQLMEVDSNGNIPKWFSSRILGMQVCVHSPVRFCCPWGPIKTTFSLFAQEW